MRTKVSSGSLRSPSTLSIGDAECPCSRDTVSSAKVDRGVLGERRRKPRGWGCRAGPHRALRSKEGAMV